VTSVPVTTVTPVQQNVSQQAPSGRARSEEPETEPHFSGADSSDDLFRTSGVPTNQLDTPSIHRKKRA
jgi:hypothetical protein